MITTTYTCDRCGHSQDNSVQMWRVEISIGSPLMNLKRDALWCRKCCVEMGLISSRPHATPPDPPAPDPAPTLEDLIRAIVREEGELRTGVAYIRAREMPE